MEYRKASELNHTAEIIDLVWGKELLGSFKETLASHGNATTVPTWVMYSLGVREKMPMTTSSKEACASCHFFDDRITCIPH